MEVGTGGEKEAERGKKTPCWQCAIMRGKTSFFDKGEIMKGPLISVIIPIYNMERYLERCLDSILRNTYTNLEVLCVDDGSKDSSAEILRTYAEKDRRIVPIFKENGGVSSARNAGLDRMTGKYVCFIDSDDCVHPQYVELLYRALMETGTNISICTFQRVDGLAPVYSEEIIPDLNEVRVYSFPQINRVHQLRAYSGGRLIQSELAKAIRFRGDLQYGEDTIFFAEVCENDSSGKAAVISYPLYYYYQREDSLTQTATKAQEIQYIRIIIQKLFQKGHDVIYLDQAIRICLPARYVSTYIYPDHKVASEYSRLLFRLFGRLLKTDIYSGKEKLGLVCFILLPRLYWLHRILHDPSMWEWEKMERRKRREEKNKRSELNHE